VDTDNQSAVEQRRNKAQHQADGQAIQDVNEPLVPLSPVHVPPSRRATDP
jgi:hypothetical protein